MPDAAAVRVLPEIADALRAGRPVVALESSVLAQGLPIPANREAARRMVSAVRAAGAVPAITGVVRGCATVGLEDAELERFLARDGVVKVSARDLPWAVVRALDGATTVAATLALAALAGVPVFATGGIGGVHRQPPFDESADLVELARSPVLVVCAGAKSILDLPATLERLETLGVPIVGFGTSQLPGFLTAETGLRLTASASSVTEVVRAWKSHRALRRPGAMLVVQAPPAEHALPRSVVDDAVARALAEGTTAGIRGAALTPFLLAEIERATDGKSLLVNLALLERNAALAAEIATALSQQSAGVGGG